MNKKTKEIDVFLNAHFEIMKIHNVYSTREMIYRNLSHYKFYAEESIDISSNFEDWISYFKYRENIDVYHSDRQKFFLQFRNYEGNLGEIEFIKMYISVNENAMNQCVKLLFNFIEKNKIKHASKVSDTLRSDSIVLRISSEEDARKIQNFIDSIPFFKNNSIESSPFSFEDGIVGYAADGFLSYNDVTADIISKYLNYQIKKNSVVSFESFKNYLDNYILQNFKNGNLINDFMRSSIYKKYRNKYETDEELINNFYQIYSLLEKSIDESKNMDDYFDFIRECNNKDEKRKNIEKFKKLLSKNNDIFKENATQIDFRKEILDSYIIHASRKYNDIDYVKRVLEKYIEGQDLQYIRLITNERNFRNRFRNYLSENVLQELTGYDIESYINSLVYNNSNVKLLFDSCIATYNQYGDEQLRSALMNSINGSGFNMFTNGNNLFRNKMNEQLKNENLLNLCDIYLTNKGFKYEKQEVVELFLSEVKKQAEEMKR